MEGQFDTVAVLGGASLILETVQTRQTHAAGTLSAAGRILNSGENP
jgi:hypothetical protein